MPHIVLRLFGVTGISPFQGEEGRLVAPIVTNRDPFTTLRF